MRLKYISKNEPKQDVYNMEVEDVHCYLATKSNIVLHNCDALRYSIVNMSERNSISGAACKLGL